jgi:AcrR family transcriptional regulator
LWKCNINKKITSRDEKAIETRKKILEEAKRLFAEHGYRNISMKEITKGANLSKGIGFHYFPGRKLEMLHTIADEGIEETKSDFDKNIGLILFNNGEPIPLKEALFLVAKRIYERFQKKKDLVLIVFYELQFVDGSKFMELLKNMFIRKKKIIPVIKYFSALKKRGEIRKLDYKMSIKVFMSTLWGLIFYSNYSGKFDENMLKSLVDYFADLWKA